LFHPTDKRQGQGKPSPYETRGLRLPRKVVISLVWGRISPYIFLGRRQPREVAMIFRKTLTLLMLVVGLALSAWAQEKPFTEEQIVNMVRAGLGNDSGARLIAQRGIDFTPTQEFLKSLKSSGAKEAFLKALRTNTPISQEQVNHMVHAGLGEASGAQMITQRGIDFAPTEDYLQSLKSAGAKEEFLKALREKMPVNQVQIVAQLAA